MKVLKVHLEGRVYEVVVSLVKGENGKYPSQICEDCTSFPAGVASLTVSSISRGEKAVVINSDLGKKIIRQIIHHVKGHGKRLCSACLAEAQRRFGQLVEIYEDGAAFVPNQKQVAP